MPARRRFCSAVPPATGLADAGVAERQSRLCRGRGGGTHLVGAPPSGCHPNMAMSGRGDDGLDTRHPPRHPDIRRLRGGASRGRWRRRVGAEHREGPADLRRAWDSTRRLKSGAPLCHSGSAAARVRAGRSHRPGEDGAASPRVALRTGLLLQLGWNGSSGEARPRVRRRLTPANLSGLAQSRASAHTSRLGFDSLPAASDAAREFPAQVVVLCGRSGDAGAGWHVLTVRAACRARAVRTPRPPATAPRGTVLVSVSKPDRNAPPRAAG